MLFSFAYNNNDIMIELEKARDWFIDRGHGD